MRLGLHIVYYFRYYFTYILHFHVVHYTPYILYISYYIFHLTVHYAHFILYTTHICIVHYTHFTLYTIHILHIIHHPTHITHHPSHPTQHSTTPAPSTSNTNNQPPGISEKNSLRTSKLIFSTYSNRDDYSLLSNKDVGKEKSS